MAKKPFLVKLKQTVIPETWCCAVRFNRDEEDNILDGNNGVFHVLPNTKRYWRADPFLFKKDGKYYLFFEMFDRLKRKGLLGYSEISENSFGDMKIIYESTSHLSYPFIFEEGEDIYIIPESGKSGELYRIKCEKFPDVWKKDKVLLNERLADTTAFEYENNKYYFTEFVDDSNEFDRLDLYYEKNGDILPCKNNPVKLDSESARCAGKVFKYKTYYIRPSQNCGASYGEMLNFNKIISLSNDGYKEETVKTLSYSDIKLDTKGDFNGIHTYNRVDNVEVVDLKIKSKFNLLNFIGVLRKAFKKLIFR